MNWGDVTVFVVGSGTQVVAGFHGHHFSVVKRGQTGWSVGTHPSAPLLEDHESPIVTFRLSGFGRGY